MGTILSIIIVIAAAVGVFFINARSIKLAWYEWLIGVVGLFLLLLSVTNYFGSLSENEPKAASMFLFVLGLPGVILLVLPWALFMRRKAAKPA